MFLASKETMHLSIESKIVPDRWSVGLTSRYDDNSAAPWVSEFDECLVEDVPISVRGAK